MRRFGLKKQTIWKLTSDEIDVAWQLPIQRSVNPKLDSSTEIFTTSINYFINSIASGNPFTFSFFTAPPATTVPTLYYKVILVFIRDCDQYSGNEQQLRVYLEQGIASLSRIPLVQVTANIACSTGHWPYCGVDVETIKAHHRAKRLAGGRMKGKSPKKNNEQKSQNSYREPSYLTCTGLAANITVEGKNLTKLETSLGLLRHLLSNNSLVIPLWDGRSIHPSFMLSAVEGSSYSLHQAPATDQPLAPTNELPPIEVDLKPLFYALGGILGLIFLCVFWKFLKHSWLLYRRKFTPINSDRVDQKNVQQLQRIMEAMEENDSKPIGRCIKNTTKMRKLWKHEISLRMLFDAVRGVVVEEPIYFTTDPKLHIVQH